ncbi:MAG: methyltransferase domain-containing protein [Rhodocyclaceae bacterium]|nr:methyltransferase domain-containing protein [Rhodocyclaceae bacterium]
MTTHSLTGPGLRTLLAASILFLCSGAAVAQERFSLFVPSAQPTVERLVKLARIQENDVVVDLGSGDGRIVLTAARDNPKVRGWGVDINENLVRQSNEAAKKQGVADRIQFFHRNVFDADIRDVTVINMWLFPELMRLLRPKILAEARPGTRVLTHLFDMGSWQADEWDKEAGSAVGLWIVPAKVEGNWSWQYTLNGIPFSHDAILEQRFQMAEGVTRAGNRRGVLQNVKLRGEDFSFSLEMTLDGVGLTRHDFAGKVSGDQIKGTVKIGMPDGKNVELPWTARRTVTTAYFRPTGVETK